MTCPPVCVDDRPTVGYALKPIATAPNRFTLPSQDSVKELLKIARQIAQSTQPGEWERSRLEQYFGVESRSLPLRERLLPIVWAARQQLINRVGARYRQLSLPQRGQTELSLLVQLHATLEAACQTQPQPEIFGRPIAHEVAFQMALSGTFVQSVPMLFKMLAIASYWVDSVDEFLDIF